MANIHCTPQTWTFRGAHLEFEAVSSVVFSTSRARSVTSLSLSFASHGPRGIPSPGLARWNRDLRADVTRTQQQYSLYSTLVQIPLSCRIIAAALQAGPGAPAIIPEDNQGQLDFSTTTAKWLPLLQIIHVGCATKFQTSFRSQDL